MDMRNSILVLVSLVVAACAAHPDPIVDMKGVDPEALAEDWRECEAYTEEIAISQGVAKGSATGAAVGAIAGAIHGTSARRPRPAPFTAARAPGSMPIATSRWSSSAACGDAAIAY